MIHKSRTHNKTNKQSHKTDGQQTTNKQQKKSNHEQSKQMETACGLFGIHHTAHENTPKTHTHSIPHSKTSKQTNHERTLIQKAKAQYKHTPTKHSSQHNEETTTTTQNNASNKTAPKKTNNTQTKTNTWNNKESKSMLLCVNCLWCVFR